MGGATRTRLGHRAAAVGVAMLLALALAMPACVGQTASSELSPIVSFPLTPLAILNTEVGGVTVGLAPGFDGQIVGSADVIETGLASEATVVFFDASVLQLGPGTRIQLSEVRWPGASRGEITVFQWVGSTWSVVTSSTDSRTFYQVETPSAIGTVRGTEFLTEVSGDGDSKFGVVEGEVNVKSKHGDDADESASVTSGSSATVTPDPTSEAPIVSDWQPSDQESSELDEARDQHEEATAALADGSTFATGAGANDGAIEAPADGTTFATGAGDGAGGDDGTIEAPADGTTFATGAGGGAGANDGAIEAPADGTTFATGAGGNS